MPWMSWFWPFGKCLDPDSAPYADHEAEEVVDVAPKASKQAKTPLLSEPTQDAAQNRKLHRPVGASLSIHPGQDSKLKALHLPSPREGSGLIRHASVEEAIPSLGTATLAAKPGKRPRPSIDIANLEPTLSELRSPSTGIPRTPAPNDDSSQEDESAPGLWWQSQPPSPSPRSPCRSPSRSPSRLSKVSFPTIDVDSASQPGSPIGGGQFVRLTKGGSIVPIATVADELDISCRRDSGSESKAEGAQEWQRRSDSQIPALPAHLRSISSDEITDAFPISFKRTDDSACGEGVQQRPQEVDADVAPPAKTPWELVKQSHQLAAADSPAPRTKQDEEAAGRAAYEPAVTPSTLAPAFLTCEDGSASPLVVGLDNPPTNYRESKKLRLHDTPFEARVDREMQKELAFRNVKKAQFKDRLNLIVAAQAAQMQAGQLSAVHAKTI